MRLHLFLLTAAALGGAIVWSSPHLVAAEPPLTITNPRHSPVVNVVKRVRGAVVNIYSERTVPPGPEDVIPLKPSQNRQSGMGTGIIIDPRGYIVTNHHVIEDVNLLRIRLSNGSSVGAQIIARDPESDLALLKIEAARPLPTIPLGSAQDLMVGETVVAIGNAYGYAHTVTVGVVSFVGRDVNLNKELSYKSLIQTDASINPGNSGGPLLNANGELVGINVAIRAGAQGIGFAIPVDTMLRVAADMLSVRRRNGLWHGIQSKDEVLPAKEEVAGVKPEDCQALFATRRHLVVDRIEPNSPAGQAGLLPGDVILKAANQDVRCQLELERSFLNFRAGETVSLLVHRADGNHTIRLALRAVEQNTPSSAEIVWQKIGIRLQPVTAEVVSRVHPKLDGGLAVIEVRPESVAARAGMQRGDILVGLHQYKMVNLENIVFVINHPDLVSFYPLQFYIIRSGQLHVGKIPQID